MYSPEWCAFPTVLGVAVTVERFDVEILVLMC